MTLRPPNEGNAQGWESSHSACPLDACKVCSACVYSRHESCARTVTCPNTGERNTCRCCGAP